MADSKISELTELEEAPATDDEFALVDTSETETKRITWSTILVAIAAYIASLTQTFTNKTIDLGDNTLTGTKDEFNAAISDADFATLAGSETLTNKTLTAPVISTISNTGTLTLPTSTDTLVGRATTDTLTNKTLTKPTINGSVPAVTADSDAATITFNMSASNIHTVTLGDNRTLAVSNVSTGQIFQIELTQDGTGSRTVTWFSTIRWAGGAAPTLTTTANKRDVFIFRCTGSNTYDGYVVGQNI